MYYYFAGRLIGGSFNVLIKVVGWGGGGQHQYKLPLTGRISFRKETFNQSAARNLSYLGKINFINCKLINPVTKKIIYGNFVRKSCFI